jgi:probable phosphoglycerate mutase
MSRPTGRANLFLVRAGRTPPSAEGRFAGRLDPGVDEVGIAQARVAASALAVEGVSTVLTGPLRRARETAEVVAEVCGARMLVLDDLTDVDAGTWTGLTPEEAAAATPEEFDLFFRFPASATMPGGERMWSVLERVSRALEPVAGRGAASVAAVTHELPIRLVLLRLRRLDGTALWDPVVAPGSITRLRATPTGLEIPTVLEDLLRDARRGQA